jgi:hypothetical protein
LHKAPGAVSAQKRNGGGLAAKCDRGAAARRSLMDFRRRSRREPVFVEYGSAVPANRYRRNACSAGQLKTIQDVITLTVRVISEHRA